MTTQDFKTLPSFIQLRFLIEALNDVGVSYNAADIRALSAEKRAELWQSINNLKGV